jgi:RNA recognition motif-containing protein
MNYGFVEYDDPAAAETAMNTLNGRKVLGKVCRSNRMPGSRTDSSRKFASIGHIIQTTQTRRIHLVITTFSLEIYPMRSTMRH